MYLSAITQRERLFDLAMRWLQGSLCPTDGRFLTLAFLLDPYITAPVVNDFLRDITAREAVNAKIEHLSVKSEVRDRIARGCRRPSPRASQLLGQFRERPERFYPTTPVDLIAITANDDDLLAMVRFKSIPRLADKVSRRATACFEQEIRRRAEVIAAERLEVPAHGEDRALAEAERQVCLELANGSLSFSRQDLRIGDLIGAKLIGEPIELERFEAKVASHPQVVSVRRSEHRGNYTDTRLEVELACPTANATIRRLLAEEWHVGPMGLDPYELRLAIPEYVEGGERTFWLEIILTTWDELVESEFGRGLHEERTERQRDNLLWARQLSTNVSMMITFMLLVAAAPKTDIDWLPIKLTGRYLPDMMTSILGRLFDVDIDRSRLTLPPLPDRRSASRGQRRGRMTAALKEPRLIYA